MNNSSGDPAPADDAEARREYDAASPEERTRFHLEQFGLRCSVLEPGQGWGDVGALFVAWRSMQRRIAGTDDAERRLAEIKPREDFLRERGFGCSDWCWLPLISNHVWEQVKACIEAGHIRPAPQESPRPTTGCSE